MRDSSIAARKKKCVRGNCSLCKTYEARLKPPRRSDKQQSPMMSPSEKKISEEPEEKRNEPFIISKQAFLTARAKTGLPAQPLLEFITALEDATAAEGRPVRFAAGLRDATTAQNKMFDEVICTESCQLGVGEAGAFIVEDIETFVDIILKNDVRSRDDVSLIRVTPITGSGLSRFLYLSFTVTAMHSLIARKSLARAGTTDR